MYSHPESRQAQHRPRAAAQRAQARAAAAAGRRQATLLAVIITILFALLLLLWAAQARAAVAGPAVSDGQVGETLAMAKSPREIFVGRWYGETPAAAGVTKRWVVDAFPDGVFRITFRFYDKNGSYREQVEVGEWGISGPVYFLSTKGWVDDGAFLKADTSNGELYDAYKILQLDAGVFEYEHYVNGSRYRVRKVDTGFALPE